MDSAEELAKASQKLTLSRASFEAFSSQHQHQQDSNVGVLGEELSVGCRSQDIEHRAHFHSHLLAALLLPASTAAAHGLERHLTLFERLSKDDYLENLPTIAGRVNRLLLRTEGLRDLYASLDASMGDLLGSQLAPLQKELGELVRQEQEARHQGQLNLLGRAVNVGTLLGCVGILGAAAAQAALSAASCSGMAALLSGTVAIGSGIGVKEAMIGTVEEWKALAPLDSRIKWLHWWSERLQWQRTLLQQLYTSVTGLHQLFYLIGHSLSKGLDAESRSSMRLNFRQMKGVAATIAQACNDFEKHADACGLLLYRFSSGKLGTPVAGMVHKWKEENADALCRAGLSAAPLATLGWA